MIFQFAHCLFIPTRMGNSHPIFAKDYTVDDWHRVGFLGAAAWAANVPCHVWVMPPLDA